MGKESEMTKADRKIAMRIMQGSCDTGGQEPKAWGRAITEITELRASLEHAMICDFPDEVRFRCDGCVKAEALLRR